MAGLHVRSVSAVTSVQPGAMGSWRKAPAVAVKVPGMKPQQRSAFRHVALHDAEGSWTKRALSQTQDRVCGWYVHFEVSCLNGTVGQKRRRTDGWMGG